MAKLPSISGAQAVKAFKQFGFYADRQQGSHVIMEKAEWPNHLSVPQHRTVKKGLLHGLIKDAGLSLEEFCSAL